MFSTMLENLSRKRREVRSVCQPSRLRLTRRCHRCQLREYWPFILGAPEDVAHQHGTKFTRLLGPSHISTNARSDCCAHPDSFIVVPCASSIFFHAREHNDRERNVGVAGDGGADAYGCDGGFQGSDKRHRDDELFARGDNIESGVDLARLSAARICVQYVDNILN